MNSLLASALLFFCVTSSTTLASSGERRRTEPALGSERFVFPSYSQQCRDDAGPPFGDDAEHFGDKRYHEGKPAFAVGDCPDPLEEACAAQKSKTAAFLEGPIDCGGRGWFSRIHEEEGWPNLMLSGDVNFGYCNTTEGREGWGFDGDGHCHGSDSDETFYWWVRDHWFRHYNGRLRCCCGWTDAVETGSIVNRCDHRRLVTPDENLNRCRDANEEGAEPYNGGCSRSSLLRNALNAPIPEDDAVCWEVHKFGEPCEDCEDEGDSENHSGSQHSEDEDDEHGYESEDEGSGSNAASKNLWILSSILGWFGALLISG